ncbi:MAG: DEAD/DEAH box helicase [Myxococcales bacterium]|nr:DEAD/DEAH box helicase family protein [Myxococcales bacterium]MCB9751962.1 DEAD/DEAH box helicase [Myxococcales bacterium]
MAVELEFENGTLVASELPPLQDAEDPLVRLLVVDDRTGRYRAPAQRYRDIVLQLKARQIPFQDRARQFDRLDALTIRGQLTPFPHQAAALEAWCKGGFRGIVEMPTGAGKTILAVLAIARTRRPTLVVVPTIDLMHQWQRVLEKWFEVPVGMLGGGSKEREDLTVTTYDSAAFQTEFHGNQFGLLVCDECHHLPAPAYRFIAEGSIAPFRLGLTATLERADGGEHLAMELLGQVNYRVPIDALEGEYLAPYEIETVRVHLDEDEQERYDLARELYINFLRTSGVNLSSPEGWGRFIYLCHRSDEGREAFQGYREQRRIALTCRAKIDALWSVLRRHRGDRIIVFTEDNDTVYRLSRLLFMPALTHQTRPAERKQLLEQFAAGELPVLLTSKVLNEGVDVPDANVGVILSGSGSVREHVQRLGRILRKRPDKRAVLYEVLTEVAAESGISERRRQHRAYDRAFARS